MSLHHLSGGFSGSLVFRVKSRDMSGHEQPMFVLKLGPRTEIAQVPSIPSSLDLLRWLMTMRGGVV